jgi:2-dehydro-3-deoxyglucarate aldolase/4-hydroxy-2-oxoheptanedioate aldolase
MVETVDALENVEEICAIEQVKALVFASGELSLRCARARQATGNEERYASFAARRSDRNRHRRVGSTIPDGLR